MRWFKFYRYNYSIVNNTKGLVLRCTIKSSSTNTALHNLREVLKDKIEKALDEYEEQAKLVDDII